MAQLKLQRIRDLIIAAHKVDDDGDLTFDTTSMASLGFTDAEIEEADGILAAEQCEQLQEYFQNLIKFCFVQPKPATVHYIGYAKLIFSISEEKQAYSYMTEEDLNKLVDDMKDFIVHMQWVEANARNDAYGNPI